MNYERIIVELLGRIQVLEEKVDSLMQNHQTKEQPNNVTTEDIRKYINELKKKAKESGNNSIILVARDIHKELNLKSRFPMVCNAMRQCMRNNDIVIFQPPKGYSSTLEIEYKL